MFYSHQLLARKAPLGQICEEINEAWKVNAAPDSIVLPKGKSHAKHEAVTLLESEGTDIGEIEQSLHFSNTNATLGFERTAYFAREPYMNDNGKEDDAPQHYHQVDAVDITLFERFDSYQTDANLYNRFERFDIEGNEETQLNFTYGGNTQIPTTFVPSPPPQDQPLKADEIQDQPPEHQVNQQWFECKEALQRLDNVPEPYMNDNVKEDDASQHYHQVDAANITQFQRFDSFQTDANLYNRFERYEAVTLPENEGTAIGEMEQSLHLSNANATLGFERTAYFAMEPYMNYNGKEDDASQHHHRVDAANITFFERFDSYLTDANLYDRFERFDIEEDEETKLNFTSGGNTPIATTLVLSPPPQDQPLNADEIQDQPPEHQINQQWFECKETLQRLNNVQVLYMNDTGKEDNASQRYHQVDAANITQYQRFDSFQTDANLYNRFERYEPVTFPENEGTYIGEMEQSHHFSNTNATLGFERTSYFALRLDNVQEPYMNDNVKEDDASQHYHQVDAADGGHGSGGDNAGDDANGSQGSGGDSDGDGVNGGHGSGGDGNEGDGDHNGGDGDDEGGGGGDEEDGDDADIILARRIIELAEERRANNLQWSVEIGKEMRKLDNSLDGSLVIDVIHGLGPYKTWTPEQRSRVLAMANAVARAASAIAVPPPQPTDEEIAVFEENNIEEEEDEGEEEEASDESTARS